MLRRRQIALAAVVAVRLIAGSPQVRAQDYGSARELEVTDLDSLRLPAAQYVGNQICRECHASAYQTWLGTKHMRAYVFLDTEAGRAIAEQMEISADQVTRSAKCLVCHATAADVPGSFRAPDFHVEEGVKCEHCHGPGGEHVKEDFTLRRQAVVATRMESPTEEDCLECHKEKPSHEILKSERFDFEKTSKRIAHPEDRETRLALLRQRPWAVFSISLRSLVSYLY